MGPTNQYVDPNHDPYGFIMNPQVKPKRRLFGLDPFIMKIILILGAAAVLMIIAAIALSAFSKPKVNITDLVGLTQTQNEIVRISYNASTEAVQQVTRNLAVTTEFSVKTQQTQLLTFLGTEGRTVKTKELAFKQNATTDQQFATAKQTSTFDLVYSQVVQKELQNYSSTLKQLYSNSTNDTVRNLLSTDYQQAQLLISQVPYTQQSIQAASD